MALGVLEQALRERQVGEGLIHHSDRGVQYLSIRYTKRLAEARIESSVGSKGDSYDNALAETVIGLYKAEVIKRREPWERLGPRYPSPRQGIPALEPVARIVEWLLKYGEGADEKYRAWLERQFVKAFPDFAAERG